VARAALSVLLEHGIQAATAPLAGGTNAISTIITLNKVFE
jgi:hypothetical protein